MNEFITRFTFQENNSSQNTYYDNIKKQKLVSFVTTSNKTMSAIAEDENKFFSEIFACFDKQTFNLCQIMNWPITNKLYSYVLKKVRLKQIQSLYFGASYSHCVQ